ncbi:hypothetical protein F0P96_02985 [Hymenobacter busanensis]|uniref:Uncharacterized protein n=1 Tax=Hymenobacter busanensis TaxID=2607656 RepID=A0A7L4ZWR8_9BACT|nr:hypothetical protein [Hymenobacter busanensis]KAA9339592.1 hypothetical protein F0P96_02985 [Hymenobacter busanensis]QHJ06652.1 hypothetical protein GUY19_04770 [Hymenobacter busanensis]
MRVCRLCWSWFPVVLVLAAVSSCQQPKPETASTQPAPAYAARFDANWAQHKLWDDGLAEVATYEAERVIYQKPRAFELTMITVKEDFNRAFDVKTDDYQRPDLFPVMKVNQFCRIPTDNYPYHFLTSLFFPRAAPAHLHKLTTSSQEWCGTTFKAIGEGNGSGYQLAFNSYWDQQGVGSYDLPNGVLFEDALPYTLRSLTAADTSAFEAPVVELQQTSKATRPVVYQARISQQLEAPSEDGSRRQRVTVHLAPGKANEYVFAADYPNLLQEQHTWDGRTLRLKSVRRFAYWQH